MSAEETTLLMRPKSEDALNPHEGSQQKLFSVEVRRISNILENCIRQVEIAASLSAISHINTSNVMDKRLSKALQEHQSLHKRLEGLHVKQESGGEQEEDDETAKRASHQIERNIKNNVRDILRLLRSRSDAMSGLREVLEIELGENERKLIAGLKVFNRQMVERLLRSPDEELQLDLYKQASPSPALSLEGLVSKEEKVGAAMKQADSLIQEIETEIKHLKGSLRDNDPQGADVSRLTDKQGSPRVSMSKKQAGLQQEIHQVKIQLSALALENRQTERVLQERNLKVENEIEYLLQDFDEKMEKKQANLELNEIEKERDEEELRRLEVPFTELKAEYDQVQEKRRLLEEKRKDELKTLELKTKAAIFAQAWWRGYSVRKALRNKGKSKKSKKGKAKKK
ncbi:dynein regulatory complex protein 10 [Betta splendens]|uniref:Dynein regulatory complex protein 10 n=1 Tax=Betta splendens TaxID=158456 RepID=A0A6P7NH06_BETSP|nr:dynein regulatory complex protein 10 [Betta splendens]XP_055367251.1 dynein regulatory complex protein 10 [Betta splendens]XP_055367252.1 dynein regulatory complex protein 10 [Betta splendens]